MSETVTKTLQATLATPTTAKEQRLQRLLDTYREALHDAFDNRADTMSAVNDAVTPYDLPYQAKDALKSYVPKLRSTYNAEELDDEHPLRLVNRAAKFDYSDKREHGFVWQAPQPGRGTNFWIPLRINPEQESLWFDLLSEDAEAGELRLQRHRTSWELHVTVEYPVEEPTDPDNPTYVGFDVGESALLTGCALKRDVPRKLMLVNGSRARHLRKEMFTTLRRLQERDTAEWRVDETIRPLSKRSDGYCRESVSAGRRVCPTVREPRYRSRRPVVHPRAVGLRQVHAWAFARLQGRIKDKATEAGIPVEHVNAAYTSQTCHACGRLGRRSQQAEFVCPHDDCHVSEFQADINAAANIAGRANPWGESVRWEPGRDDSPQDGSACDSATVHRETGPRTGQMTLSAYSD